MLSNHIRMLDQPPHLNSAMSVDEFSTKSLDGVIHQIASKRTNLQINDRMNEIDETETEMMVNIGETVAVIVEGAEI